MRGRRRSWRRRDAPKAVTIATNMAGRGTDIVLGGAIEPQILKLREDPAVGAAEKELHDRQDALRVAGAPRRRDRRRRSAHRRHGTPRVAAHRQPASRPRGRQGDPGSRALPSLEDPLLRIFGGERLGSIMQRLDARRRADRASDRQPLDRQGAEPRRVAQFRHPEAAARIRRRRQRPAPGDLSAAQRVARSNGHLGYDPQHDRRAHRRVREALHSGGIHRRAVGRARASRPRSPRSFSCRRRWASG